MSNTGRYIHCTHQEHEHCIKASQYLTRITWVVLQFIEHEMKIISCYQASLHTL